MIENKVENLKPFCIYKDDAFTIEHTMYFDVPGYLILFFNKDKPIAALFFNLSHVSLYQ